MKIVKEEENSNEENIMSELLQLIRIFSYLYSIRISVEIERELISLI